MDLSDKKEKKDDKQTRILDWVNPQEYWKEENIQTFSQYE